MPWIGAGLVVLLAVAGVAVWAHDRLSGGGPDKAATSHPVVTVTASPSSSGTGREEPADVIAARPIPGGNASGEGDDPDPQPEVQSNSKPMKLPGSSRQVNGVATGYPRTGEGAVAQLAAMDVTGFHDFDTDAARSVYTAFSAPGAVGMSHWMPTRLLNQFYADYPDYAQEKMSATYQPIQGLLKGVTDGGNTAVVCINGRLSYSYDGGSPTVAAQWDCARMQWSAKQKMWVLGPGSAPSPAPQTWPRDAKSYKAGFRDLENAPA